MTQINLLAATLPTGWRLEGFRPFIEDNGTEQWRSVVDRKAKLVFRWPTDERMEFRFTYLPGVIPQTVTFRLDGRVLETVSSTTSVQEALLLRRMVTAGEHTFTISSANSSPNQSDPVLVKLTSLQLSSVKPALYLLDRPVPEVLWMFIVLTLLISFFARLLGLWPLRA